MPDLDHVGIAVPNLAEALEHWRPLVGGPEFPPELVPSNGCASPSCTSEERTSSCSNQSTTPRPSPGSSRVGARVSTTSRSGSRRSTSLSRRSALGAAGRSTPPAAPVPGGVASGSLIRVRSAASSWNSWRVREPHPVRLGRPDLRSAGATPRSRQRSVSTRGPAVTPAPRAGPARGSMRSRPSRPGGSPKRCPPSVWP